MYKILLLLCLFSCESIRAQQPVYSTANAHSHNDYEKPVPFYEAYGHQFGSIEADIFLIDGSEELYVAHTVSDLGYKRRTLDSLYLLPLIDCIRKNKGYVYADSSRNLQFLIDIKTEARATLARLITMLNKYPELINTRGLQIVISGNRPPLDSFDTYPPFIQFDGVPGATYTTSALSRIALLSASFRQFSTWNGKGVISEKEIIQLTGFVDQSHKLGKPVRLWAAPDTVEAWKELIRLRVDFINTDRIAELSEFLKNIR